MKKLILAFLVIIFSCTKEKTTKQPLAPSVMAIDEYHGQKVEDPYRNLENLQDSTVIDWLRQQGDYAFNIIENISGRQGLIDKQISYDVAKEYTIVNIKNTANGEYFYLKTLAKEQQEKIYYKKSMTSEEILLYDPTMFPTKEKTIISGYQISWDGKKIAVNLSEKGGEASEIIIIDVATQKVLPQIIENTGGNIQWLSDNSGFIYRYHPNNNPTDKDYHTNSKSIVYTLGSDPKKLHDVFSKDNNPELSLKSEDFPAIRNYNGSNSYVFGIIGGSSAFTDIYITNEQALFSQKAPWKLLCTEEDKVEKIRILNDDFIFLSAKGASNFQICKTSIANPNFENPEVLVEEKQNQVIRNFELTKDGIFFTTEKNGVEYKLHQLNDAIEKEIVLPNPAGDVKISSNGPKFNRLRIVTSSHFNAGFDYMYNPSDETFIKETIDLPIEYPDFKNLIIENIEIPSHDGVMVPVTIIRQKNIKKDGNNSTLFFGYGAYGASGGTSFNPSFLSWVVEGGILVFPDIRGNGTKGDAWHKAGFKTTKPNTWKDMIASVEYLIKEGYTKPEKSAIWGSSAGGILAGRAMTERPDLFGAVIMTSPATNMLRSEIQPNGQNSIKEFGTVKIKEEFEALLEMDAYHHIEKGVHYPATYITGGMKDGRVVIWDSAKFIARLQASNASDNPILFGVNFEDGHSGMNSSRLRRFELYADALSFAFWQTGHPDYQPKN